MELNLRFCSSLVKVMPEEEPIAIKYESASVLLGETFSFQLVYYTDISCYDLNWNALNIEVISKLKDNIIIRSVELVPIDFMPEAVDADIVGEKLGLYPDLLKKIKGNSFVPVYKQWRALWITVFVPFDLTPGKYSIKFRMAAHKQKTNTAEQIDFISNAFILEVIGIKLPEQKLINTHWFHCDCLATYYKTEIFSDEHWRIIENFVKNAVAHGMNMLLTPLFTPPLDTLPGTERPTVQLVEITKRRRKYYFDFSNLEKWIKLAQKCGIKYFEMAHFFSQWGATSTPKIIAKVNGKDQQIFGWNIKADSKEYDTFLSAFVPELITFINRNNLNSKVYFHVSDEPRDEHLETYAKSSALLRKYLKGFKIFDALSCIEFYDNKLVEIPVVSEDHLDEFAARQITEHWTYYCCIPVVNYSNRFIYMSSSRNRIIGALLYRYDITGFLHWGYNFYYSQMSLETVDPYKSTTAGHAFPAGDAFLVYPGENGIPEDSIRHEVFFAALQDLRALQLLEKRLGTKKVKKILDRYSPDSKMTMVNYPRGEEQVISLREKINKVLKREFFGKKSMVF